MRKQKILIVLFAGSLVLPGVVWTGFSGRFDTENNENRKLAEFPEVNLESLGDFPEQFEAYYKDHVPFKNDLVKFCNFIDTEVFRNTKIGDVVIGEDNWLFYLPEREGILQKYQPVRLGISPLDCVPLFHTVQCGHQPVNH